MSVVSRIDHGLSVFQDRNRLSIDDQIHEMRQKTSSVPQYNVIDHALSNTSIWVNDSRNKKQKILLPESVIQQVIEVAYSQVDVHGEIQLRNFTLDDLSIPELVLLYRILESFHKDPSATGRKIVLVHLSRIEKKLDQLARDLVHKQEIIDEILHSKDGHAKRLEYKFIALPQTQNTSFQQSPFKRVGEDLLITLFEWLDPSARGAANKVCKYWNGVLKNPIFQKDGLKRLQGISFFTSPSITRIFLTDVSPLVKIELAYGQFTIELKALEIPRSDAHPIVLSTSDIRAQEKLLHDKALIKFCGSLPDHVLVSLPSLKASDLSTAQCAENLRNELEASNVVRHLLVLDLPCCELTILPPEIKFFRSLAVFNLCNNRLSSLPDEITELKELDQLYLQNNYLTFLPKNFGSFTKLTDLYLSNNNLRSLPDSFCELNDLNLLYLQDNEISSLPKDFSKLVHLTHLDVHNNRITHLPENFGMLIELDHLDLANNLLPTLPEDFGGLADLEYLDLQDNEISDLPNSFCALVNLERLYFKNNKLKTLPNGFGKLTSLLCLVLNNNQIAVLPVGLDNLQQLQNIHLQDNQLSDLPNDFYNLVNLLVLEIQNNPLSEEAMSQVQDMGLEELTI